MQILLWTDLETVWFLHVLDPLVCLALWIDHQRPAVRIGYNNCVIKRKTESGNHKTRIRTNRSWKNRGLKFSRDIQRILNGYAEIQNVSSSFETVLIFSSGHAMFYLLFLYYYMRNFCNMIGLEQWYFSLI